VDGKAAGVLEVPDSTVKDGEEGAVGSSGSGEVLGWGVELGRRSREGWRSWRVIRPRSRELLCG
jgi:hypothetical protein